MMRLRSSDLANNALVKLVSLGGDSHTGCGEAPLGSHKRATLHVLRRPILHGAAGLSHGQVVPGYGLAVAAQSNP
ncbi:hypothetical protein GCM10009661_00250 [Catellatospora chokoriensis]|uniref:Uncharacterized protein n=1 Tax=Catellatospora chokoriensis TaxID=310353 RepID=A0A8J3NUV9_9ACTN|nr:hypothetical protein Cch02nite_68440 [Catellatospora chokoriensis]